MHAPCPPSSPYPSHRRCRVAQSCGRCSSCPSRGRKGGLVVKVMKIDVSFCNYPPSPTSAMPSGETTRNPPPSSSSDTAKKLCPSLSWPPGRTFIKFLNMFPYESKALSHMLVVMSDLRGRSIRGNQGGEAGGRCWRRASAWPGAPGRSATPGPGTGGNIVPTFSNALSHHKYNIARTKVE